MIRKLSWTKLSQQISGSIENQYESIEIHTGKNTWTKMISVDHKRNILQPHIKVKRTKERLPTEPTACKSYNIKRPKYQVYLHTENMLGMIKSLQKSISTTKMQRNNILHPNKQLVK